MKFIYVLLCLNAISHSKIYPSRANLENRFDGKYIKANQIESIRKRVKFSFFDPKYNQNFDEDGCEVSITLDDGPSQIVTVLESCIQLVGRVNEGIQ